MDADALQALARLIRRERIATLGTLRNGAPNLSMVAYLHAPDFSVFSLRVSRLAWHTQDMARVSRVSLAICETDDGRADPQTLARVMIRGEAAKNPDQSPDFERLKRAWLDRFPESAVTFELADFSFLSIAPRDARFVAGLGRTYNLGADELRDASLQA